MISREITKMNTIATIKKKKNNIKMQIVSNMPHVERQFELGALNPENTKCK